MKQKCMKMVAIFLCLAMVCGNALAFDSDAFREKNSDTLEARGILLYGMHEFREGLMPVLVRNTWNYQPFDDVQAPAPDTVWNYINEKLEIVDLNKGRFYHMFPFFEGLAAVVNDDGVGYIDKTGKLVIPCQFGGVWAIGDVYTGYFKNGVATVMKESCSPGDVFSQTSPTWEVGKIDKTGTLVEAYRSVPGELGGKMLIADNGYMPDEVPSEEPEKAGLTIQFEKEGRNLDNGISYDYTLKNHTDSTIKKYSALLTYAPNLVKETTFDVESGKSVVVEGGAQMFFGQIHAIDVDLAAGASIEKSLVSCISCISELRVAWIDFDSLAERDSFLSDSIFGETSNGHISGYRSIDSATGATWMKNTLGITIGPAQ